MLNPGNLRMRAEVCVQGRL